MRIKNFGDDRRIFEGMYRNRAAMIALQPEQLWETIERGLGLPDDVLVRGLWQEPALRSWTVAIVGPEFAEVEEGTSMPLVHLILGETRIVP